MATPKTLSLERIASRRSPNATSPATEIPGAILETFVYGAENGALTDLFSLDRLRELATYSPIYLYGPHGVGKSALAQSLAARYCRLHHLAAPVLCDGADFARALAAAIDADDMERFRRKYRDASLLVIDGLQDLAKKGAAQDELIQTLDHRESLALPTLLTGPSLPQACGGIRPALASRIIRGLSLALRYPGVEARLRLLSLIAKKLEVRISSDELEHLGKRLTTPVSAPEIHGLLLRWLHQERLDRNFSKRASTEIIDQLIDSRLQSKTPSLAAIAKFIAHEHRLKLSDLRGPSRRSQIVRARSLAMYLSRELTGLSFQQIGDYFGHRDHTTVMHACRKIESEMGRDPEWPKAIEEIRRRLEAEWLDA